MCSSGLPSAAGAETADLLVVGAIAQILNPKDLPSSLEHALEVLRRAVGADDYELFLPDPELGSLGLVAWGGVDSDVLPERTRFEVGVGYPGLVSLERKPIVTKDLPHDGRYLRRAVIARGIRSYLCVPLCSAGSPVPGSLHFAWRRADASIDRAAATIARATGPILMALHTARAATSSSTARKAIASASAPSQPSELRIRCLGKFEIELDGRTVPAQSFPRRKAVTLLKMLVLGGGKPASQLSLAERLWPGADEVHAVNCLHGLVHAIRTVIEPAGSRGTWRHVVSRGDAYAFDVDAAAFVDVVLFRKLVERARARRSQAGSGSVAAVLEEAVALYRGDLFEDEPLADWCAPERLALREGYVDALRELAGIRASEGDHARAVQHLRAALRADPLREDLHRLLIKELLRLSRRGEARQQYETCVRLLREELAAAPAPETLRLEREIAAAMNGAAYR